jgi:hypothetical protein
MPPMRTWSIAPGRIVIEIDYQLAPGLGLELEVLVDDERGRTFGLWTWSKTGEVLRVIAGAEG